MLTLIAPQCYQFTTGSEVTLHCAPENRTPTVRTPCYSTISTDLGLINGRSSLQPVKSKSAAGTKSFQVSNVYSFLVFGDYFLQVQHGIKQRRSCLMQC